MKEIKFDTGIKTYRINGSGVFGLTHLTQTCTSGSRTCVWKSSKSKRIIMSA